MLSYNKIQHAILYKKSNMLSYKKSNMLSYNKIQRAIL